LSVVSFGLIGLGVDLGTEPHTNQTTKQPFNKKKYLTKKYTFDVDYTNQKKNLLPYFTKSFKLFQFKGLFFILLGITFENKIAIIAPIAMKILPTGLRGTKQSCGRISKGTTTDD
jgi:hypothetical protein